LVDITNCIFDGVVLCDKPLVVITLVGWFSEILEWEWLGKLGWLETVTPVMGGELSEQVGNQFNVGGLGGCSGFQNVVRIQYDGFCLGFGVVTPETGLTTRRNDSRRFQR
jgi:hypothetical protein